MDVLRAVVASMAGAARAAGVAIVVDVEVVPRGAADKMFVTTAGVGLVAAGVNISAGDARPGDRVLLSGTIWRSSP